MFRRYSVLTSLPTVGLAALPNRLQASDQERDIPWWAWVIIIVLAVLLLIVIWCWLRRRSGKKTTPAVKAETAPPARTVAPRPSLATPAPPTPSAVETRAPDDLKRIEGIGPKISKVLQDAGIATFEQLAANDASRLEQIVRDAGIRLADPTTWPEQASLAAAGKWEALEKLQDELKGGRRV